MKTKLLYSFILLLSTSFSVYCGQALPAKKANTSQAKLSHVDNNIQYITNSNAVEVLEKIFPTFYGHLRRAGYLPDIESAQDITIFAPTEQAFQNLIDKTIGHHAYQSIFFNNTAPGLRHLKNILNLHIFPEKILENELIKRESLQPYSSARSITVNKNDNTIRIDSDTTAAIVVKPTIIVENGVIYAIDAVLF